MLFKQLLFGIFISSMSINAFAEQVLTCDKKAIEYAIKKSDDINTKIVNALKEKDIDDPALITNIYFQNLRIKENLNTSDYSSHSCLSDYVFIEKSNEDNLKTLDRIKNISNIKSSLKCYGKVACDIYKTILISDNEDTSLIYISKNYEEFLLLNTLSQMLYQASQNKNISQNESPNYKKLELLLSEIININDDTLNSFEVINKKVPESYLYKNKNNCQMSNNYFSNLKNVVFELKGKTSKEDTKKIEYINNVLSYLKVKAKVLNITINSLKELNDCLELECKKANLKKGEKIGNSYITSDDLNNLLKNKTLSINKLKELEKN